MKNHLLTVAALCLFASAPARAQSSLLPDHFGAWRALGPASPVKPGDLGPKWEPWTEGNNILEECGVRKIEDRAYANGGDQLGLRVYLFGDPSSAYEFYTFAVPQGMKPLGIGENSAIQQDDARLLIGNLVLQAGLSPRLQPAVLQGVLEVLKSKADPTPLPPIRNYLPSIGRVFGSEKYALGPGAFESAVTHLDRGEFSGLAGETGFASGAEAMFAHYRTMNDEAVLLLIEYPTPQLAEQHLRHLYQAISSGAKESGTTIERRGSLLMLVLKPTSAAYGDSLRGAVNYQTEVTWNEPTHAITDPPWATILGKIIIFTMLFMVVAVVLGIAFGGVRIFIKARLPGRVFDRPERMEVLQLGLSGKRIDPRDFY